MKTIVITGPSGSGKTFLSYKLSKLFYNSIVMSYYIIPFILSPNAYSKEYRTKYFRFMALTIAINEMINYYYLTIV